MSDEATFKRRYAVMGYARDDDGKPYPNGDIRADLLFLRTEEPEDRRGLWKFADGTMINLTQDQWTALADFDAGRGPMPLIEFEVEVRHLPSRSPAEAEAYWSNNPDNIPAEVVA